MKNIAQIKVINNALSKEREYLLNELAQVTTHLDGHLKTLNKFMNYLREYNELHQIILIEQKEIEKLQVLQKDKLKKIQEIEQKIHVMDHFEDVAVTEKRVRQDKSEQSNLDELNSLKHSRGDYE
jgi:hypothetical protein